MKYYTSTNGHIIYKVSQSSVTCYILSTKLIQYNVKNVINATAELETSLVYREIDAKEAKFLLTKAGAYPSRQSYKQKIIAAF